MISVRHTITAARDGTSCSLRLAPFSGADFSVWSLPSFWGYKTILNSKTVILKIKGHFSFSHF
ncbi:MAG: hypothetical protein R3F51_00710 [Cyanobacteriota/Melainabacteria group bacterium]